MSYTVKKLAKLSGVSVRTLHWYDQINLLKPASVGANGYRYYEQRQLLQLQQILFLRELDVPLEEISKIISSSQFNQQKALLAHKKILECKLTRTQQQLCTIDKTIEHLKGGKHMGDEEFFAGLNSQKQKEYEQYLVNYKGKVAEDLILECSQRMKKLNDSELKQLEQEGNAIYQELAHCLEQNMPFSDEKAQKLIDRHYQLIGQYYTLTQEVYQGLAELYCEHEDFRKYFDRFHKDLANYIAAGMNFYLEIIKNI